MYVISTFSYSEYLELAISELESKGINRENILAIPLVKKVVNGKLFDTMTESDGISLIDTASILGSVFMLLGTIYGFVLRWGPILWGLIGLAGGAALGFIIDIIPKKRRLHHSANLKGNRADVVLIINCETSRANEVESILGNNNAISTGRLMKDKKIDFHETK